MPLIYTDPKIDYTLNQIIDKSDVFNSLNISASAAFSFGAKVSSSVKYALSKSYSSYSAISNQVIDITFDDRQFDASDFTLNDYGRALYNADPAIFRKYCGDQFTRGVQGGARAYAILSISSSNSELTSSLEAAISAKGQNVSANANVQTILKKAESINALDIRVFTDGITSNLPKLNIDGLTKFISEFPSKIEKQSQIPILNHIYQDYVPLIISDPLLTKRTKVTADSINDRIISKEFDKLADLIMYRNNVQYILTNQNSFLPFNTSLVQSRLNLINRAISIVLSNGNKCVSMNVKCFETVLNFTVPSTAPEKASPWIKFDPTVGNFQLIGNTGQSGQYTLQLEGKWKFNKGSGDVNPVITATFLQGTDLFTAQTKNLGGPIRPGGDQVRYMTNLPNSSKIELQFYDCLTCYTDNSVYDQDPARGRIGTDIGFYFKQ